METSRAAVCLKEIRCGENVRLHRRVCSRAASYEWRDDDKTQPTSLPVRSSDWSPKMVHVFDNFCIVSSFALTDSLTIYVEAIFYVLFISHSHQRRLQWLY